MYTLMRKIQGGMDYPLRKLLKPSFIFLIIYKQNNN